MSLKWMIQKVKGLPKRLLTETVIVKGAVSWLETAPYVNYYVNSGLDC